MHLSDSGAAAAVRNQERLEALRGAALLDTPAEAAFDRITRLVTRILGVPISLVSLVDADRQFFKSCVGLGEPWSASRETPLSHSFCQHTVATAQPLVIDDARDHPVLRDSLAITDLRVIAYAGIPLVTEDRHVLGSLCAIDTRPREWKPDELQILSDLADAVMTEISLRAEMRERQRAERELAERERTFRTLVEAAGDLIFECDVEGRFTYVNPAFSRSTGYAREEMIGRSFLGLVGRGHRDAAGAHYHRQLVDRVSSTYYELPVGTAAGGLLWLGANVQLIESEGEVAGFHVIARDVSQRREIDRMKDEFAGLVSHELRTPLTSIRASLRLLASGALGRLEDPRGERMLRIAEQNAERLVHLTNDVLTLERLGEGRDPMHLAPVPVSELLRRAARVLDGMAEEAGVAVRVEDGELRVMADGERICQVLVNLLSNAIKFSPRGSEVRMQASAEGEHVRIEVADQGRGIPADRLASVFERFEQVEAADAKQKGGSGLGLAIARAIVDAHGGRIWAESSPGRGATFSMLLPRPRD